MQYLHRLKEVKKEIRGGDLNYIKYTLFYQSLQYIEWVISVSYACYSILSSAVFYGLCSFCINFHILTKKPMNCEKQGHMTGVRNLKPFILIFLLGISCITAYVLLDWGSFSDSIKEKMIFFFTFLAHNHTCVKTEEFDAVTVVSYSNIVSINSHTQSSRLRGYKLPFLQRRLTIALKDQMR